MTNLFEQPFEKLLILKLTAAFGQKQFTKPVGRPSMNHRHAYQISKSHREHYKFLQQPESNPVPSFLQSFLQEERVNEVSCKTLPLTDWADAAFPPARWTPAVVGLPSLTATASSHQPCSSTPTPGEAQTPGTSKERQNSAKNL